MKLGLFATVVAFITVACAQPPQPTYKFEPSFETVKVADGVYAFLTPTGGNFVNGNSVLVVGKERALVVDSAHFPAMTRAMIAEVRKLTKLPVRFLVNTHWHADHVSGNSIYADEFPGIAIVSTEATRQMVANFPEQSDDVKQITSFMPQLEKTLADNRGPDGKPLTAERRAYVEGLLAQCKAVLPQVQAIRRVPANVAFHQRLTIDLGGRLVEIAFLGRGNTAGDAIIYVPDAKVLVTGDLDVSPVPYAFGSFISEWIETLKKLDEFDATSIVPGHGAIQHDREYLHSISAALQEIQRQVSEGIQKGQTDDQIFTAVDLPDAAKKFSAGDAARAREFNNFFLVPATKRAIAEARKGKLTSEF